MLVAPIISIENFTEWHLNISTVKFDGFADRFFDAICAVDPDPSLGWLNRPNHRHAEVQVRQHLLLRN
jgi:hypothetical protein